MGAKTARDKIPVRLVLNPMTLISDFTFLSISVLVYKVGMIHTYLLEKKEREVGERRRVLLLQVRREHPAPRCRARGPLKRKEKKPFG